MPIIASLILTNQLPINTYTASVMTSGSVISDGLGNQLTSLQLTSSYSTTCSFALNGGGGGGSTLTTGSTYQITSSWANNAVTYSYITQSVISSSFASSSVSSSIAQNVVTNSIQIFSPIGGNSGNDYQNKTASFEGQVGISYNGTKEANLYFASINGATGSNWVNAFNFPGGIGSVGQGVIPNAYASGTMSNINSSYWMLNGSSAGSSAAGDSIFTVMNWSTSSNNSGAALGLAIHDATGSVVDAVGCAFNHVPQNRIKTILPGWALLVFNTRTNHMKGLSVCSPGISLIDSGNYSIAMFDFTNRLFRVPRWATASYQPSDAGWVDSMTVNPTTGESIFYGTSSFYNVIFASSSYGAGIQNRIQLTGLSGSILGSALDINVPITLQSNIQGNLFQTRIASNGTASLQFPDQSGYGSAFGELKFYSSGPTTIGTYSNTRFRFDQNLDLYWLNDGGGSIGLSGSNRPNNIYIKNMVSASTVVAQSMTASNFVGTSSWSNNSITASFFSGSISNAISASYAITASFALNSFGTGTTLTTASTYQITASVAQHVVTNSIQTFSPVGGNSENDYQTATSSFEGQLGVSWNGTKQAEMFFAGKTNATGSDWVHAFNFPGGISNVGQSVISNFYASGTMDNVSNTNWHLNGSSAGSSATGDSLFRLFNWSTSSVNSGASFGMAIMDATASVIDPVGCCFTHVPQNRIKTIIPGTAMLVFNTNATHMKALSVCSPGISLIDSGNYSIAQFDFINKLFRVPRWLTASYQPSDAGWADSMTVNPMNGNVSISQSLYVGNVFVSGSITSSLLFGTASFANTASYVVNSISNSLAPSGSNITVDFNNNYYVITASAATCSFVSSSNGAAVKTSVVYLPASSSVRALSFNSNWMFIGAAAPTASIINKSAVLSLTTYGANESGVIASWGQQQ